MMGQFTYEMQIGSKHIIFLCHLFIILIMKEFYFSKVSKIQENHKLIYLKNNDHIMNMVCKCKTPFSLLHIYTIITYIHIDDI
jgi:hypothetical protein